jgi:serine/threonine-protein kinase
VAVRDGRAIAYVCDGRRVEAWLKGTASAGKLDLRSVKGARLTGSYRDSVATGTVVIGKLGWSFRVKNVRPPSGLYRAAATVRKAKIVGGWIVLADGTQVGVLSTDMVPAPAPSLNTSTRGTTVDGVPVTAAPIDGATGSGF